MNNWSFTFNVLLLSPFTAETRGLWLNHFVEILHDISKIQILQKDFRILIDPNSFFHLAHVTNVVKLTSKRYLGKVKSMAVKLYEFGSLT